jgi:hypothetical protein
LYNVIIAKARASSSSLGAFDARWPATAIAITDNEGPTHTAVTNDWPRSNPKGYGEWF